MEKYIVYSVWFHEKGLRPAEEMRDGMLKNVKPHSPAEDVIWWKMDDNQPCFQTQRTVGKDGCRLHLK